MKKKLYWLAAGGGSFWIPVIVASAALHQNMNLWMLNIVPLAGLAVLGATTWICTNQMPKWGWVWAGIYVLGHVSMIAPSFFVHSPSSGRVPGQSTWVLLACLFPPMTLWMALLNGTLFSVLIATVTLPFLAAMSRRRETRGTA